MSKTEKEMIEDMYKVEPSIEELDTHMEAYDKTMESLYPKLKQIGGRHYAKHSIQPWDIIDDWDLDYYLGNVIKYVLREKNDKVEDLHKAIHYLEKKIELLEKE